MNVYKHMLICLVCSLCCWSEMRAQNNPVGEEAGVTGRVIARITADDKIVPFGYVCFFRADGKVPDLVSFMYWKTPDYIFPLDKDGNMDIRVPEGSYYIIAVRTARMYFGPIESGDYYYYIPDNKALVPIEVFKGKTLKVGTKKAVSYDQFVAEFKDQLKNVTSIRGIVQDETGAPIPDIFVAAYVSQETLRPDYVSPKSGRDGSFELRLPGGGKYFILARHKLGPPSVSGDAYVDVTKENALVEIKTGETIKRNIRVKKIKALVNFE